MWTAVACGILMVRFCRPKNINNQAAYGSAHSLFLGIFMVAITYVEQSVELDAYSYENILRILDIKHFTTADLVKFKRHALLGLDFCSWISEDDIKNYAANNLFDVIHLDSSTEHYLVREKFRSIWREKELKHE
ncbi:hypothetical protein GGI02_004540, partial [Coemansia sp. RSA 2322]